MNQAQIKAVPSAASYKTGYITNLDELFEIVDIADVLEELTGLRPTSMSATAKMRCPIHDDHDEDSQTFVVFLTDQDNYKKNTWICKSRSDKGNVWQLVQEIEKLDFLDAVRRVCEICGVEDEIVYASSTERSIQPAADLLNAVISRIEMGSDPRFHEDLQEDLKISFPEWISESPGVSAVTNDLAYDPVQDSLVVLEKKDGDIINIRFREKFKWDKAKGSFTSVREDGKWFPVPGCPKTPYWIEIFDNNGPVFVFEGVKDRLSARLLGLNHIALDTASSVLKVDDPSLISAVSNRVVLMYPDADKAGQKGAERNAEVLKKLAAAVEVIDWRDICLNEVKDGFDLTDFVTQEVFGIEEAQAVLGDPSSRKRTIFEKRLGIETANPFGQRKSQEDRKKDFINADFLPIRRGKTALFVAPGGTGKTYFMLLFLVNYIREERKPVLYVVSEEDATEVNERLRYVIQVTLGLGGEERNEVEQLVHQSLKFAPSGAGIKRFCSGGNGGFQIDHEAVNQFRSLVQPYEVIVLDPLISFYCGNENDNGTARQFMDVFLELSNGLGKTVILVHHTTKGTSTSRGASAFVDAARSVYEIRRVKKNKSDELDPEQSDCRDIYITKDNYGAMTFLGRGKLIEAMGRDCVRVKMFRGSN